ncbi:MAG: hypothetical protein ABI862_16750 [Ilumatobacteraceae bacterium]
MTSNNGRSHGRHASTAARNSIEFAQLLDPIRSKTNAIRSNAATVTVADPIPQPKPASRFAAADASLDDDRLPVYTKPRGSRH